MKKIMTLAACTLVASATFAEENVAAPENQAAQNAAQEQSAAQDSIKELAELGPGVHKVKTADGNVFKSCVVVGQARISTVLGASKGLATARRNAKLSAEAAFVDWLKTKTSSVRSRGDETEFKLKGDGETQTEAGASTETSTETITSCAQGAVRGLTLIGSRRDPETKMLTQVYAWKPGYARIADQIESAMKPEPSAASASAPATRGKANADAPKTQSSPIKEKTVVAPEAKEFL